MGAAMFLHSLYECKAEKGWVMMQYILLPHIPLLFMVLFNTECHTQNGSAYRQSAFMTINTDF